MLITEENNRSKLGFTLAEVMIASLVLVVAATLSTVGFVYVLRSQEQSLIQTELDSDVQMSMERIKYTLRLSARDKMLYYPPGSGITHTAVSFPMPTINPLTGVVDIDTNNKAIWGKTVIYHAWTAPFSNQLRVTTFSPRNNDRTDVERQTQLAQVVQYGDGHDPHVLDYANGSTEVIFENLFHWNISEIGGDYDGYATYTQREESVKLGTVILAPGDHTFTFTVISNNASCVSGGCKIGIDSLNVSPSGSRREAEAQRVTASSVPLQTNYMSNGSWSGNYQLFFPAAAVGQSFTLTMANDTWEDTNFRGIGEVCERTDVFWDTALSPSNFIVALTGTNPIWSATTQTKDATGNGLNWNQAQGFGEWNDFQYNNHGVRVLIRGNDSTNAGGLASSDGVRCRVNFRAGMNQPLQILYASIARAVADSPDQVPGTVVPLTFNNGASSVTVPAGSTANPSSSLWTDFVALPGGAISPSNSYVVSFKVSGSSATDRPWLWLDANYPSQPGSYRMLNATATEMASNHWDSSRYTEDRFLVAVQYLALSYPSNGYYTSEIFDTTVASNTVSYNKMSWRYAPPPTGASIGMQVRTGNNPDMSDASAWGTNWQTASPHTMGTGGRYVQWKAMLTPNADYTASPKLKDVSIGWDGETKAVDVSGSFTKGPNYGILQCTVDGQLLRKAVGIDMAIYETAPNTGGGEQTLTSTLTEEVEPRNTGK